MPTATTTTLFAAAVVRTDRLREFRAYLYESTVVIATQDITGDYLGREQTLVLLQTTVHNSDVEYIQQYQCDRLASGMLGLSIGFQTREDAVAFLTEAARGNGYDGDLDGLQVTPAQSTVGSAFRTSEAAFLEIAPQTVSGLRVLKHGRFNPGGSGCYGSIEVVCAGDAGGYSTHTLIFNDEQSKHYLERGHYCFSTWDAALADFAER